MPDNNFFNNKQGWNFKKELIRKSIHLFSVIFLVVYVLVANFVNHKIALLFLSFLLVILFELEYARVEVGAKIPLLRKLWEYRRDKEKNHMGAEIYFLLGAIISLAIYDLRIAAAGILMVTFGDMAAAVIGTRFGRTPLPYIKDKAWEGFLAELAVNLLIGFIVLRQPVNGKMWWDGSLFPAGEPMWIIIVIMAVTATVVETAVKKLDDNLLVPVIAGFNGEIIYLLIKGSF
ncbi:MAG: SEC59/DGK1/VTE5 family protein [Candidatus Firestonebacteria bacterium]|nr:SEC59/DGK1/VTE5 family protein [Candidatus Firestonebacteria bacterium]